MISKVLFFFLLQAECIQTGTGPHVCVCQQGWTGDGRDCVEINNCLLPGAGGCHDNATCLYVGPGQVGDLGKKGKRKQDSCCDFFFVTTTEVLWSKVTLAFALICGRVNG